MSWEHSSPSFPDHLSGSICVHSVLCDNAHTFPKTSSKLRLAFE